MEATGRITTFVAGRGWVILGRLPASFGLNDNWASKKDEGHPKARVRLCCLLGLLPQGLSCSIPKSHG